MEEGIFIVEQCTGTEMGETSVKIMKYLHITKSWI